MGTGGSKVVGVSPPGWVTSRSHAILMMAILLLGLMRRETFGIGRIGFEGFLILMLYGGAVALLLVEG